MKKVIEKEVSFCDHCGKEIKLYATGCMGCGLEYCHECRITNIVGYNHGVYAQGTRDGRFCNKCNANPPVRVKRLMGLYKKIAKMRTVMDEWNHHFDVERKQIERELEVEYDLREEG